MTALPPATDFTGANVTEAQFKTAITSLRDFLSQNLSATGGGKIGINIASPDGTLHVHTASAGAVAANTASDDLVVENNATGGITILTPNNVIGRLTFGDPESNIAGAVVYDHANTRLDFVTEGSTRVRIDQKGILHVGETDNASMTIGLTINQGANDDEVIALKSSDIAHGVTNESETDTYAFLKKNSATGGGLLIEGLAENTIVAGVRIRSLGDDTTTKSTVASGIIEFSCTVNDGTTNAAVPGANSNLVVFQSGSTTRFILDAEGDSHQDVGTAWTNFDEHDDAIILQDLSFAVSKPNDPIRKGFTSFLQYNREKLEALSLVKFNDDGHHFVNMSKLTMLHTGAIRQEHVARSELEQAVAETMPVIAARLEEIRAERKLALAN